MKKNIFDILIDIIILLLSILIIYWLIKLILGGSPDLSQVNFALIIAISGILFKMYREIGEIKVEIKHLSIGVKQGFEKVKEDMDSLKNDMALIKKKLKASSKD